MQVFGEVGEQYADFASYVGEESPSLRAWSDGVAGDREVVAWLETLPVAKRQPNLVFAAARWHGTDTGSYDALRRALLGDDGSIRATVLERATQTNEVGRLATLLPALALAAGGGPVSLIEVGASAGLCLYPDRWGYRWIDAATGGASSSVPSGHATIAGSTSSATAAAPAATAAPAAPAAGTLTCAVSGSPPYPTEPLRVAARAGIDLHPLDVTDDDAMGWLETLVWPEQEDRRALLRQAIRIARSDPPPIETGDLLALLPAAVERAAAASPDAVVVVFHSAVIAYLEEPGRAEFARLMAGLVADGACRWVSNEGPHVLPGVAASGPEGIPAGRFVLGLDGTALAWTHGHGRSMEWVR